jgi:DNA-binding NtrC family response regulator
MTIAEQYSWPGNVRELRNFCERMVILFAGRSVEPANLPAEMRTPVVEDTPFILPDTGIRLDELEQQMIRQALDKTPIGGRGRRATQKGGHDGRPFSLSVLHRVHAVIHAPATAGTHLELGR